MTEERRVGTCALCEREGVLTRLVRDPDGDGEERQVCVDQFACFSARRRR